MALLTALQEPDASAADRLAEPTLRVGRAGGESQRSVPLAAGKYTIGSSPQCQIVLPGAEVRPLQCLVAVDAAGTVTATRWAAGVSLNGGEFTKAQLHDGDRLAIDDWQIIYSAGLADDPLDAFSADSDAAPTIGELPEMTGEPLAASDAPPEFQPPPPAASLSSDDPPEPTALESCEYRLPAAPPACFASQHFADGLVLHLWTANHAARSRAKSLLAGIRAARFHADAMAADIAAMETELHLARAAYDSHLENNDRLQEELNERVRDHHQQTESLSARIAELERQLAQAIAKATQEAADHDRLCAELVALQAAPPVVDPALAARAAELEAALAAKTEQLGALATECETATQEQRRLADELHQLDARCTVLSAEADELRTELEQAAAAAAQQSADYDQLTEEQDRLAQERDQIKQDCDRLTHDHGRLTSEHEEQAAENLRLAAQCDQLAARHDELSEACDRLTVTNQRLSQEHEQLAGQHEQLVAGHGLLAEEHAALLARPPAIDPALVERNGELEATVTVQAEQLAELAAELHSRRQQCDELAEQFAAVQQTLAIRQSDERQLREQLEEAGAVILRQAAEGEALAARIAALELAANETDSQSSQAADHEMAAIDAPAANSQQEIETAAASEAPDAQSSAASSEPDAEMVPSPPDDEPAPAAVEYAPPSFIAQYRHLLDDQTEPSAAASRGKLVIDEEFLSPAKAPLCDSPVDDSDEALEAYMANLMRRVRQPGPALVDVDPSSSDFNASTADGNGSAAAAEASAPDAEPAWQPSEPLTIESLRPAVRRPAQASDLAALREIANNSARTAIAVHDHNRIRQSAMTKVALAVTATAATLYLFLSAPTIGAWQIWAGVPVCVVGVTAAAQAVAMKLRGR